MAKRMGVDLRITRQLLLIGMMCAKLQRFDDAERIIRGVKAFRSDVPHPGTALATSLMFQGRLHDAMLELETVLSSYPDHQLAKALLGLVYREVGRNGWQSMLQEVIDDGRDMWSIQLASQALGIVLTPQSSSEHDVGRRQDAPVMPAPTAYA